MPLAIRQGGGADLGLAGGQANPHRARNWLLRDAPKGWRDEEVSSFLSQQHWTEVKVMSRRRGSQNRAEWGFRAIPPTTSDDQGDFWFYSDQSAHVTITPISSKTRPPKQSDWIQGPRKTWADPPTTKAVDPSKGPAPTQIDSSQTSAKDEAKELLAERDRSPRRKGVEAKGDPDERSPEERLLTDLPEWKILDMGGSGDCFFRTVAHIVALQQNKTLSAEGLSREAANLRLLAVRRLKNNAAYREAWLPDPSETSSHRGGAKAAESFEDYCALAAKQGFYADGMLLQALSERIKKIFVVWRWNGTAEIWERYCIRPAENFKAKPQEVILLVLQDDHYRCLVAQDPKSKPDIPESWAQATATVPRDRLRGAGKTCSSAMLTKPRSALSLTPSDTKQSPRLSLGPSSAATRGPPEPRSLRKDDPRLSLPSSSDRSSGCLPTLALRLAVLGGPVPCRGAPLVFLSLTPKLEIPSTMLAAST